MKIFKLLLVSILALSLVACESKPSEEDVLKIEVDGHDIIVGAWTVKDMYDNGFSIGYMEGDTAVVFDATELEGEEIESMSYYSDIILFYGEDALGDVEITNATSSNIPLNDGVVTNFYVSSSYASFESTTINGKTIDFTSVENTCSELGGDFSDSVIPTCTFAQDVNGKNNRIVINSGIDKVSVSSIMLTIAQQ